jgi:hypothetical protein
LTTVLLAAGAGLEAGLGNDAFDSLKYGKWRYLSCYIFHKKVWRGGRIDTQFVSAHSWNGTGSRCNNFFEQQIPRYEYLLCLLPFDVVWKSSVFAISKDK